MWVVENNTPYKASGLWTRNKDGVHEWIVAVRATFDIPGGGNVVQAEEQQDPVITPEYKGEPGLSSVLYDMDMTLMKPTTDILLNGTAYAPGGRPSTEFIASMQVGTLQKKLRVLGNRWWEPTGFGTRPSSIHPVVQVPIEYERAWGGYDTTDPNPKNQKLDPRNPIGVGVAALPEYRATKPVHNFEYPSGLVEKKGPAGFGAIDCYWSPRREYAGTYDKKWEEQRLPLLPLDWDSRSLQSSPKDQQPATYLQGGEYVELVNLSPSGALRFALPKKRFKFKTFIKRASGIEEIDHTGNLVTVIFEPDHTRLIMVWVTTLRCRTDMDYLEQTLVEEVL